MKTVSTAVSKGLTVVLALALAGGLAACNRESQPNPQPKTGDLSSNAGPGGIGSQVDKAENVASDTAITARIKVALLEAPDLKSTDISVDTSNGQVTLTGTVPQPQQVEQAGKVVGGVEGVRNVDNKLTVKSAS